MIRKANARWEKVCQFIVPVVSPLTGNTAMQPITPPIPAINRDSNRNETTTLVVPKPNARMVAISRDRSATAEYMVLSAPKTAPIAITAAISVPSTVISVVSGLRLLGVVAHLAMDLYGQPRVRAEGIAELLQASAELRCTVIDW